MDLRGWDYVGRNVNDDLHGQFRVLVDCLSDPHFVQGHAWGGWLQGALAHRLGTSPGQVRTIKRACEDLGLIKAGSLRRDIVPCFDNIITEAGKIVYNASKLEQQCRSIENPTKRNEALKNIKGLYESGYVMAMTRYHYRISDVPLVRLHPLRAIFKAFAKFGPLDKWEWYLLNTYIRQDDDVTMEAALDTAIKSYRAGALEFRMENVTENPKGHQYLPQILAYAGFVELDNGRNWRIYDNKNYKDIKTRILSDNFLREIYSDEV